MRVVDVICGLSVESIRGRAGDDFFAIRGKVPTILVRLLMLFLAYEVLDRF